MTNSSQDGERRRPIASDAGFIDPAPFDLALIVPKNSHSRADPGSKKGQQPKSCNRIFDTHKPDKIGGEYLWRCLREQNIAIYRNKPGFKSWNRTNTPNGMRKAQREVLRVEAELLAKADMINLERLGLLMDTKDQNLTAEECLDNQRANDAIEILLTIARDAATPVDVAVKAASKVADILKPRAINPKALRATVQVDAGLAFLDAIGAPMPTIDAPSYEMIPHNRDDRGT